MEEEDFNTEDWLKADEWLKDKLAGEEIKSEDVKPKPKPKSKPKKTAREVEEDLERVLNEIKKEKANRETSEPRELDGMPSRERFSRNEMQLSESAKKVMDICLEELRRYMEHMASTRAGHFGYKEIGVEDVMTSYTSLQSGMTIAKIAEIVNTRLLGFQ